MPDICMCHGGDCVRKETCYRHEAEPTPRRQAFFDNPPVKPDGSCSFYWPLIAGKDGATNAKS